MENEPYMLLFRNTGPENHQHLSAEQRQQLITRWNAWFEGLLKQGKATEGQPLEAQIHVVHGPAHQRVVDGPFSETKESVGGYVKLRVSGLDEALAIANAHPGLEYGLVIEVRSMMADCHLGVTTTSEKR